jgi:hypothetical protein
MIGLLRTEAHNSQIQHPKHKRIPHHHREPPTTGKQVYKLVNTRTSCVHAYMNTLCVYTRAHTLFTSVDGWVWCIRACTYCMYWCVNKFGDHHRYTHVSGPSKTVRLCRMSWRTVLVIRLLADCDDYSPVSIHLEFRALMHLLKREPQSTVTMYDWKRKNCLAYDYCCIKNPDKLQLER